MICTSCGREMPPPLKGNSPLQQRIIDCLLQHPDGITASRLIDDVYWDDPNGGPIGHIRGRIVRINAHLKSQGYQIRGTSRSAGSKYVLVKVA